MTTFLQNLLPRRLLTEMVGAWAARPNAPLLHFAIQKFVDFYNVNLEESKIQNIKEFKTFNDFFSRELKENAREISNADFIFPCDGKLSEFGKIQNGILIQAKNHYYDLNALLANNEAAKKMEGGLYFTIYLSPKDYHRVHMPTDGVLKNMQHIHGTLYSVNQNSVNNIPGLFAKNERLVCCFQHQKIKNENAENSASNAKNNTFENSALGEKLENGELKEKLENSELSGEGENFEFFMVLVGATIVGSIATQWEGTIAPPRPGYMRSWDYENKNIMLNKAAEMGRFLMGSTVILIFPKNTIAMNSNLKKDILVKLGDVLGDFPR